MLRKRSSLFLLFFFILFQARSQNLVPNPSFEQTNTPPPCDIITSKAQFDSYLPYWTMPSQGTSDIYSKLVSPSCEAYCFSTFSAGHQAPRTGNNMCGFLVYESSAAVSYREYIQVKLKSPLIIGKKYYAEIFVSAADNVKYGCDEISMYFSENPVSSTGFGYLPVAPQIRSPNIITDTDNWVKISGTFTATTAIQYLTIGNFNDDGTTRAQTINATSNLMCAYYYIDDVYLEYGCNPKDSSASICGGSSITLNMNDKHVEGWSLASSPNTLLSNTATLIVSPLVTTSYIAHYECNETSTFEVIVDPMPTFNLGKDSTICKGETISFDATTEHANYLWQDGSTAPKYTVGKTGLYTLTITNGCSSISDNVFITVNKPSTFSFGTDTTICAGETITFNATADGATYLWQDGSTNPLYTITDTGYYAVTIKNVCGTSNENISLHICCAGAKIPNLITPNGDGMNETFYIDCFGNGDYELIIYNTWGAIVYENKGYLNNWGGEHISDGIYYYVIRYKTKSINNGWVQVLR